MNKLKLLILIVFLLSATLISRSICKSNLNSVPSSQQKSPTDSFRAAEWTPERRLIEMNQINNTFIKAVGDTIIIGFSIEFGWHVYFIKSENNGESWESCITLGDSLPRKDYTFPELAKNGSNLVLGFALYNEAFLGLNLGYFKSSDMGSTWGTIGTVFSNYSENLTYLSSLSGSGTDLYFSYYKNSPDSIYVIRSTDWGNTWSERGINVARASLTEQNLCIRASGNYLHLVWGDDASLRVKYSRSTDYGSTWSAPLDITRDVRGSQFPYLAVQDSHVVVCWMGYRNSPTFWAGDYFFRHSYDNGSTWDNAVALNNMHQTREVRIDLDNSILVAAWQDQRLTDSLFDCEIMSQISTDNGQSWLNEELLSTFRSSFISAPAISLRDNTIHIAWGDDDLNVQGLYYCSNELISGVNENHHETLPNTILLTAYPNPFNFATTITLKGAEQADIGVYDITGRLITTIHTSSGQVVWDASGCSSGLYFAREGGNKTAAVKLVLVK